MITYELAKELEEKGYSQEGIFDYCYGATTKELYHYRDWPRRADKEFYEVPTLSELIAACGDGFRGVMHPSYSAGWVAQARISPNSLMLETKRGDTPEEAVARLWIALQKYNAL